MKKTPKNDLSDKDQALSAGFLLVADAEEFTGERAPVDIQLDQSPLPL